MSQGTTREPALRQWISVGGYSCDLRIGAGSLEALGTVAKGSVSRPHRCLLAAEEGADEALVVAVRHRLTDAGFVVAGATLPAGARARSLQAAECLAERLAAEHITSDDLICALGAADALSLVSYVAGAWCGGTPLALLPLTLDACLECCTTPRGIDVAGSPEMLSVSPCAKHLLVDVDLLELDDARPDVAYARALMASTALVDTEQAFGRLWDRAELVAASDAEALTAQLADTAKSRAHIVSATAVALKQTVSFGQTFMRALAPLASIEAPSGPLLAEAIRFQCRLAAGMGFFSVDDVLTVDELLDMLGLAPLTCDVAPEELAGALRQERFLRSGRFLLGLPHGIGSVRLASVEEDLLLEHARAWCAAHASDGR